MELTKTHMYMIAYREIEPVVHSYFTKKEVIADKGEFGEEARLIFITQYMASLNRGYQIIIQNQKEETVQVQLITLISTFELDEDAKKKMEEVTLWYWKSRMVLSKMQATDIYNYLFLRLTDLGVYPKDRILRVREVPSAQEESKGGFSYTLLDENPFESLTGLYSSLKEQKCIAPDTDLETFYNAFTGKPLWEITKRIVWIRPKILCVYFIFRLLHIQKISKGNVVAHTDKVSDYKIQQDDVHWKQLEHLFEDKKGRPMDNGAKEFAKIGVELMPDNTDVIDNILVRGGLKGPINKW